ncbi:dephospho-CoA kinase domain-containing protein-like [Eurytemora carolleeae]|uniref:dephospho-CoA kinase domain-containing protein-like n=1 Tax=Eurytemora carolleeae TaxID=1294199 RepID=UPI000C7821CE|nr:dephospho-CoA kinase domain-containing protein-like [Eurytemora carolleeae]|eukprot:XP_023341080.1 dephospho-CoA kinase domain-containing protein-like [Eurytemora affinis]
MEKCSLRYQFCAVLRSDITYIHKLIWIAIKDEFGSCVFHDNGELNRAALRTIIFEDENQRQKLNRITHPEIYREMCWEAVKCAFSGYQFIIMDLPLLFEAGVMVPYMHKIVVVTCEEDLQLQRLMEQRHLSERESKLMIGAQMPLDVKATRAQFVIENSGNLEDSRQQVNRIHKRLSASYFHWKLRLLVGLAVGGVTGILYFVSTKVGKVTGRELVSLISGGSK